MAKSGKRYRTASEGIEARQYGIEEAVSLLKRLPHAKFDESVDVSMRLGVNPKHADQMVRGAVVLPHGTGKSKRVLVIASGEKVKEAQDAGAEFVGGDDMVEKVAQGWLDFDAVVATPDMMRSVGKLGRVLGPRGLMPNPKTGTVSFDIAKAISDIKAGKVEFKVDKAGALHGPIGRLSFDQAKLVENALSFIGAIHRAKPSAAKGKYMRTLTITTTMGPGLRLDPEALDLDAGEGSVNRVEKTEEVAKLKAELGDIRHAFVIDYKGVTVPQVSALRRQVRKLGAEYRVLKNTLLRRAVEGAPLHALSAHFTGPTALAWHRNDPVQLAKALRAFATATPAVSFRCALVDGELVSAERIADVANLPGLDVLKGRLVYLLASPMSRFVTVLSAPSRGLASVLKQHADKQS